MKSLDLFLCPYRGSLNCALRSKGYCTSLREFSHPLPDRCPFEKPISRKQIDEVECFAISRLYNGDLSRYYYSALYLTFEQLKKEVIR